MQAARIGASAASVVPGSLAFPVSHSGLFLLLQPASQPASQPGKTQRGGGALASYPGLPSWQASAEGQKGAAAAPGSGLLVTGYKCTCTHLHPREQLELS